MTEGKLVQTRGGLLERLEYVARRAEELGKEVLGKSMLIDTLAIFTQSQDERAALEPFIRALGPESRFTHGKTLYVEPRELVIAGNAIKYLGMRDPDETRTEVGYADYPVDNFGELIRIANDNPYMTPVTSGRGQALIEFKHPDFDIRAYAVAASEH